MRLFLFGLILTLVCLASAQNGHVNNSSSLFNYWQKYYVKKNDTIYNILRRQRSNGLKIINLVQATNEVKYYNPNVKNPNQLGVGQLIIIPTTKNKPRLPANKGKFHKFTKSIKPYLKTTKNESSIHISYFENANIYYTGGVDRVPSSKPQVNPVAKIKIKLPIKKNDSLGIDFTLRPVLFYSRLDATDKTSLDDAFVTSKLNMGLEFSLSHGFFGNLRLSYSGSFSQQNFSSPSKSITSIENESGIYYGLNVRIDWQINGTFSVYSSLGAQSLPYFLAKSSTEGILSSAISPVANIGVTGSWSLTSGLQLFTNLYAKNAFTSFSGDISSKGGLTYGAELALDIKSVSWVPGGSVYYERSDLTTDVTEQAGKILGVKLGWNF